MPRPTTRPRPGTLLTVTAALLVTTSIASAQQRFEPEPVRFTHPDELIRGDGFMVLADRRVFATMAWMNAVGYDDEYDGVEMHPVRVRVREMLEARTAEIPDKLAAWRDYYDSRGFPTWVWQDTALSLSADHPFRRIRPESELEYPSTAEQLADFPEVLNDFWESVRLDEVWAEVAPDYRAELARYDFDRMRHQLDSLWEYVRMERQDPYTLVNVPNLLEKHYTAIGAGYGAYYYQVESPGSHSYGLNVHEYLHALINPLVAEHFEAFSDKLQRYYESGKDGPMAGAYQHPRNLTQESMVRALDHRLRWLDTEDPEERQRIEARVAELTASGVALVKPFYDLLARFESTDQSLAAHFPELLKTLADQPGDPAR